MNKVTLAISLLVGLPLAASAEVSKEDLKKLCAAGISDDVILSYVRSNGPVRKLSAGDLVELRQAGASDGLLAAVLSAPAPAAAPSPVAAPPAAPESYPPPSTSYVYTTSPSYGSSVVCDDTYPSTYYSLGYPDYCAPSFGLGYAYYGGRTCGGYYGGRYYGGSRFAGGVSTYRGGSAGGLSGGHSGFGGGHSGGGGFGGGAGHGGGGGHR